MTVISRCLFIILATFFFYTSALAQSSDNAANELAQLLSRYKTYKANFKQRTYSNGRVQISSGRLYMQRPGKFRWEVNTPNRQIIIANDKILWVYDVELSQVTKEKINLHSTNNPAVLLSGDAHQLIRQYHVSKVQYLGEMWYQLKPHSPQSSFVLVRMRFFKQHIVAIWVKNNLGQRSAFHFSHIQLNISLSPSLFNFKLPPGVDILQ